MTNKMSKRAILGLTETIILQKNDSKTTPKVELVARIDSGATISSIDLELAKKLELGPVVREKTVKQATGKTKRPVMLATVRLKGITLTGEFSIADRKRMKFPVLIGQNILKKGSFLIDCLID